MKGVGVYSCIRMIESIRVFPSTLSRVQTLQTLDNHHIEDLLTSTSVELQGSRSVTRPEPDPHRYLKPLTYLLTYRDGVPRTGGWVTGDFCTDWLSGVGVSCVSQG